MLDYFARCSPGRCCTTPTRRWRNDELYIPVLRAQLASLHDEYERIAPQYDLGNGHENRLGQPANDSLHRSPGASGTLYGLQAEYVLLFINNLGCDAVKSAR